MTDCEQELKVTEGLMEAYGQVLDAIPPCPAHGGRCTAHALEWIERMKLLEANSGRPPTRQVWDEDWMVFRVTYYDVNMEHTGDICFVGRDMQEAINTALEYLNPEPKGVNDLRKVEFLGWLVLEAEEEVKPPSADPIHDVAMLLHDLGVKT